MASRKDAQKARMRRLSLNKKDDDTLSLNRPRSGIARAAAKTQAATRRDTSSTITDKEMRQIDKDIEARAKAKAKDKAKSKGSGSSGKGGKSSDDDYILTDKEVKDIIKEGNYKVKPKLKTEKGKRGLIFGKDAKFRPFGGILARALLGEDEKFGGDRGAIDFIRSKKKPQKKSNGGEMKKKGYAMGGAAMKSKMASKGGAKKFPDLTGDGKVTQADILKGRGVKQKPPGMMGGGMMKSKMASKGGKMGGKMPPGMKKGGAVRKKARGVGAAKRGFGKAMR